MMFAVCCTAVLLLLVMMRLIEAGHNGFYMYSILYTSRDQLRHNIKNLNQLH
jgi:hypothetical protein